MNIKLLDIPAQIATKIRGIVEQPIPELNRAEFQRLFYVEFTQTKINYFLLIG